MKSFEQKISKKDLKWALEKKIEREKLNSQYENEFEKTRNPDVVIRFLKASRFAIREPWVFAQITKWHQQGDYELLKKAFLPVPGERARRNENALSDLMLFDKVNELIDKEGLNLTQAFERLSQKKMGIRGAVLSPGRIKNIYYHTKKASPEVYVSENGNHLTIAVGPTKISMGDFKAYGYWEMKIPK